MRFNRNEARLCKSIHHRATERAELSPAGLPPLFGHNVGVALDAELFDLCDAFCAV